MSNEYKSPSEHDTLLWRKSIAENYLYILKFFATQEGIEKSPVMVEKIKAAEKKAERATRLYGDFIKRKRPLQC